MSTQEMAATLKEIYKLWVENDERAIPMLFSNLSENIRWCSIADGCKGAEFSRERNGIADVQGYFEELSGDWEMIHFTVDEFVCEGDRVIMIGNCAWRYRKTGVSIETPKIDTWKIQDNKIVEFSEYYDTAKMMRAIATS